MATSKVSPYLDELSATSLWHMSTRLPRLIGLAWTWAWRAAPWDTAATIGLNLAAGVFTAVGLFAVTGVLEPLFTGGPTPERVLAALPSLALVAAAYAARALLQAGAGWAQARLRPQVERLTELHLFDLTSRIRLDSFDDADFNDTMYRARDRGQYEAAQVISSAVDFLTSMVSIVAAAGVLAVLHPLLLPLLALTVIPDGWAAARAARMRYERLRDLTPGRRRKWALGDMLASRDSAAELRAFTMRSFLLAEYTRISDIERAAMLAVARRQTVTRLFGEGAGGVATAVTYAALGGLLIVGAMPLAVAGTAVFAIRTAQSSLSTLLFALSATYESGLYFSDFLEFSRGAARRLPEAPTAQDPARLSEVRTRAVVFAYPGEEEPALDGVDIDITRGEVVALVGENGSGKSTLARLLAGLYTPQSGAITWNGTDIAEIDPDALRARIGLVNQEYTQWPLSAQRNVTMSAEADGARLAEAARLSGADEVVAGLARGWDTILDKRFADGADLSGGQWQRVASARGLYRDADLLIADEPTAALDARAEKRLFESLHAHAKGRTVLLITHRLASVRMADRIYVLDKGRVVEHGDHEHLMAGGGLYAELFRMQAQAYEESMPRKHDAGPGTSVHSLLAEETPGLTH
ncbi:ABC transporter ATP-binding protein [Streptomonospora wellingtoniae]|uniref:ATP-binding cassette domain-containing protein n=1 Tax=Streptomonospora wellingtoniae TaxID=3075544 RepID=A0ABU2KN89_9ACTN|nr:ATP-binding cassette domain-containing protein [Streptomonospora sp. DSM 45055]MDT0300623.1 ATP-binding cassette domain-containing protein [Streptomonospora sp. DSM 45055]